MRICCTGANRGLGLEFCRQYHAEGAQLIAGCRKPTAATELAAIGPERLELIELDVNNPDHLETLHARLADQSLDLVINNAGVYGPRSPKLPLDRADFRGVLETNVLAPMDIAAAALPALRRSRGTLVNITSKMGSISDNQSGGSYMYRSSKAALNAAMHSLARDVDNDGVRVLLLHPGWVRTDMGGPHGLIDAPTSVAGMREVIAKADELEQGGFYAYDGAPIGW